ncbi:hypothetical protein JCM10908_005065 [Rhodotorula pacifica]|uniref:ferritin-like domain-containing protein n=1 Tax=Rhodotorula pacifica TaxID=1495444 RepID=UPI00317D33CA
MARFSLLAVGLLLALGTVYSTASLDSRPRDFVLERRLPEQDKKLLEVRSQHLNTSASSASGASSAWSKQSSMPLSEQVSPSGAYTSSKTTEPAATATASIWTSAASSYSSLTTSRGAYTSSNSVATTATASMPAPSGNASSAGSVNIDIVVLQLAVVLEAFEGSFYREGLQKFGLQEMLDVGFSRVQALIIIEQIQIIIVDERKHFDALSSAVIALGAQPYTGCGFDFSKALTDPLTFLSAARSIEAVGVSAYLGAAHLLQSADLLEAAASILTLEARHQSLLNVLNGGSYNPQSFDIQLTPQAVLSLVGGFLTGCKAQDLGLTANQPLSVRSSDNTGVFRTGSQIVFEVIDINIQIETLFCQMIIGGSPIAHVAPASACYVPSGLDGPVAVYLTSNDTPLATDVVIQNQLTIVAGPGLIFIDEQITILAVLLGSPAGSPSASGNRTLPCADLGGWAVSSMRELGSASTSPPSSPSATTSIGSSAGSTGASGSSMASSTGAASSKAGAAVLTAAPHTSTTGAAATSSPTYRMLRRRRNRLNRA